MKKLFAVPLIALAVISTTVFSLYHFYYYPRVADFRALCITQFLQSAMMDWHIRYHNHPNSLESPYPASLKEMISDGCLPQKMYDYYSKFAEIRYFPPPPDTPMSGGPELDFPIARATTPRGYWERSFGGSARWHSANTAEQGAAANP
ncbi:MAG: hypothetical protein PHC88_16115 [Terrimicrobiaceae bacterium]|nr:hypothetical protein [Terrimicrobiaceae bacterium]